MILNGKEDSNIAPFWTWKEILYIFAVIISIEILFYLNHEIFMSYIFRVRTGIEKKITGLLYVLIIRIIDLFFIIYYTIVKKKGLRGLGISLNNIGEKIKYGVLICLAFGTSVFFAEGIYYLLFSHDILQAIFAPNNPSPFKYTGYLLTYILVAVIYAPFLEEVVFRGILYPALREHSGKICAVILNALIFASAHGIMGNYFTVQFIGGIIFAYMYERTASIIPSYIVHSSGNLAIVGVVYFYTV